MKLKRIYLATLAVMLFSSLAAAQHGTEHTGIGAGAEGKIIEAEKRINDAVLKEDMATFKSLVDMDEAWVVGPMGAAKVADVIKFIFDPNVKTTSHETSGHKVMVIDPDAAIITYKSVWSGTENGKSQTITSYDTTVWAKRGGKWLAVFHQSTEMQKPE